MIVMTKIYSSLWLYRVISLLLQVEIFLELLLVTTRNYVGNPT